MSCSLIKRRKDLIQSRREPAHDQIQLFLIDDERWSQQDVMSSSTINRSTHRIAEQAVLHCGVANLFRKVEVRIERLFRLFILD